MKKITYLFLMTILVVFTFSVVAFAEDKPYELKSDEELNKDEAVVRIQEFNVKISNLEASLKALDADVVKLQQELENTKKQLKDCQDEYNRLLGVTDADIDKFRQAVGVLEGKVRGMQRLTDDQLADRRDEVVGLEKDLWELRKNKISILAEFYDRLVNLGRDIKGLYKEKKIKSYTVGTWAQNKDCLWNIAGKVDIYGDPFSWPRIWQSNTNLIKNPDIIHPGQVLVLPPKGPKTNDDIKAERKYWRNKRAANEAKSTEDKKDAKGATK
jgi:hypothetical protein